MVLPGFSHVEVIPGQLLEPRWVTANGLHTRPNRLISPGEDPSCALLSQKTSRSDRRERMTRETPAAVYLATKPRLIWPETAPASHTATPVRPSLEEPARRESASLSSVYTADRAFPHVAYSADHWSTDHGGRYSISRRTRPPAGKHGATDRAVCPPSYPPCPRASPSEYADDSVAFEDACPGLYTRSHAHNTGDKWLVLLGWRNIAVFLLCIRRRHAFLTLGLVPFRPPIADCLLTYPECLLPISFGRIDWIDECREKQPLNLRAPEMESRGSRGDPHFPGSETLLSPKP